jgi:hypothetical protein
MNDQKPEIDVDPVDPGQQPEVNRDFVRYLKATLDIAEKGGFVGGLILGLAEGGSTHWLTVPPEAIVYLLGELGIIKSMIENQIIYQRTQANQGATGRRAGLVVPGRH